MRPDAQHKKNASTANGSDSQIPSSSAQGKVSGVAHGADEPPKLLSDEGVKVLKPTAESEVPPSLSCEKHESNSRIAPVSLASKRFLELQKIPTRANMAIVCVFVDCRAKKSIFMAYTCAKMVQYFIYFSPSSSYFFCR
jgi:hypothetical protein